jgi:3-methyladenine DNA glycosylase Tag
LSAAGDTEAPGKRKLELLVLEGAQAGLSWSTILKKRE